MASAIDDFDVDTVTDPLTEQFNRAANHVKSLVDKMGEKQLLLLYGAYKQATTGKCNVPRPRWYEMQAKAKWDAWNALEDLSQDQAKQSYVQLVQDFDPEWDPACATTSKGGGDNWAAVSSPLPPDGDGDIEDDDKTLVDFVKEGNTDKVVAMLRIIADGNRAFPEQVNGLDGDGLGLIHWAADRGNVDMLRCLLDFEEMNVNRADSSGQTALHYAASCGHVDCVQLLLDRGGDVYVKDEDGYLAVDISTEDRITDLLQNRTRV